MFANLKVSASRYMRDHMSLFVFITVLFIVGVMFGSIVVSALAEDQVNALNTAMQSFFSALTLEDSGVTPSEITWHSVAGFLKTTVLLWILGLSIIGLPVIVVLIFVRGFMVGFTVGVVVSQFKGQGILFVMAAILPQNLIYIPALLICGVAGISFSLQLVQSRFSHHQQSFVHQQRATSGTMLYRSFLSYTGLIAAVALAMVLAAFVEGYLSPMLMKAMVPTL